MSARTQISAGLLLYRRVTGGIEVLVAHPGGPFYARRDDGAWTLPKGEIESGDDALATAIREFQEETGVVPSPPYLALGTTRLKSGKTIHAWAFEGDTDVTRPPPSNTFRLEWPPRSGRFGDFPEIDRLGWFDPEAAKSKLNPAQGVFVDRLVEMVRKEQG